MEKQGIKNPESLEKQVLSGLGGGRWIRTTEGIASRFTDCIRLIAEIKGTEEQPFPVNVKADLTARFETGDIPPEELDEFMKFQTVQILLPYLRSMISSVTTGAYMPPIILPLLNAHDIFKE